VARAQSPTPAAPTPSAASTAAQPTSNASAPALNPGLHLDLALNLVVLQFFNAKGDVIQSIPSQKQLEAYQQDNTSNAPGGHGKGGLY
jgi:hypothetical protein